MIPDETKLNTNSRTHQLNIKTIHMARRVLYTRMSRWVGREPWNTLFKMMELIYPRTIRVRMTNGIVSLIGRCTNLSHTNRMLIITTTSNILKRDFEIFERFVTIQWYENLKVLPLYFSNICYALKEEAYDLNQINSFTKYNSNDLLIWIISSEVQNSLRTSTTFRSLNKSIVMLSQSDLSCQAHNGITSW